MLQSSNKLNKDIKGFKQLMAARIFGAINKSQLVNLLHLFSKGNLVKGSTKYFPTDFWQPRDTTKAITFNVNYGWVIGQQLLK